MVGIVDGARAALVFGVDAGPAASVVALSVAVDALWGCVLGKVVELIARVALWGRRARTRRSRRASSRS